MKHIISALVENKPGVLAHVAGMFAARGFNIDSLVVGRTEDPNLSRMTIVVIGDDRIVEQVRKQRPEVFALIEMFRGHVVDISQKSVMVEVSGPETKIEAFIDVCRPYGIKNVARTGTIAMPRQGTSGED
jgi:acetolactate synthase-1/3 small subunit